MHSKQIGLWWYRTFDASGFLFKSLKSLSATMRYFFYISLTISIFLAMQYASTYIHIENYIVNNEAIAMLTNKIGYFILYAATFLTALITSYEFIIDEDVNKYLTERKAKKQAIKLNKLQFWRLRNMKLFVRLALYTVIYFILQFMLKMTVIVAFFTTYASPTSIQLASFENEYLWLLKLLTMSFIIVVMILEYFVNKTIRLNRNIMRDPKRDSK